MQTPRRYAPLGGSFAPVRVAGFKWNGWQASAVYAFMNSEVNGIRKPRHQCTVNGLVNLSIRFRVQADLFEQAVKF